MANLAARDHWVFDMDGTLTVPQHDFDQFKADYGLPSDRDVLGGIDTLPPARQAEVLAAVDRWEEDLARSARPMPDAVRLLERLAARGVRCGILTRNTLEGARITLEVTGLSTFFAEPSWVLGRSCAPPKPSPAGIVQLLELWGARPEQAVMVGDWVFDAQAGRAAGAATVLVARHGPVPVAWHAYADVVVDMLDELET